MYMSWLEQLRIFRRLQILEKQMADQNAQITEIKADLAAAKADLTSTKTTLTQTATDILALVKKINDLQLQLASNQPVDLTDVVAAADALKAQADDILASAGATDATTQPPVVAQ